MLKQILLSFIISLICIIGYHFYWKKEVEPSFIKGIYTVNLQEVIDEIKKDMVKKMEEGNLPEDYIKRKMELINEILVKLEEHLPPGYILMPENVILGGKNVKHVDLLKGEIKNSQNSLPPRS